MAQKIIYCPRCGKPISMEDGSTHIFCMHCGYSIDTVIPAPTRAEDDSKDGVEPANAQTQSAKTKKKKVVPPVEPKPEEKLEEVLEEEPNDEPEEVEETPVANELVAESTAEEQELINKKKQLNRVARTVGILYSECTKVQKAEMKTLSFLGYLKGLMRGMNKLIVIALAIFFAGILTLSITKGFVVGIVISGLLVVALVVGLFFDYKKRKCSCGVDLVIADHEYDQIALKKDKNGKTVAAKYRFRVVCPKCGKEKTFEKTVQNKNGNYDLRAAVGWKAEDESFKEKWELFSAAALAVVIGLVCLIIAITGLINTSSPSYDPKDYYGTYGVVTAINKDQANMSGKAKFAVTIDEDFVTFSGSQADYAGKYKYEYVEADKLSEKIQYVEHPGLDAILVYDLPNQQGQVLVLYIVDDDPYSFEMGGLVLDLYDGTNDEGNAEEFNPDPKDYYGSYCVTDVSKPANTGWMGQSVFSIKLENGSAYISGTLAVSQGYDGTFDYTYYEAETIREQMPSAAYKDKDAIVITISEDVGLTLYILDNDPYEFDLAGRGLYMTCYSKITSGNNSSNKGSGKSGNSNSGDNGSGNNGTDNSGDNGNGNGGIIDDNGNDDDDDGDIGSEDTEDRVYTGIVPKYGKYVFDTNRSDSFFVELYSDMEDFYFVFSNNWLIIKEDGENMYCTYELINAGDRTDTSFFPSKDVIAVDESSDWYIIDDSTIAAGEGIYFMWQNS